ncbi:MAG: NfeD-like C-terminal, partner-binding [Pyrinomonadaceae bacterium]|nr:NfeD-like C-terminal, partner-binding [Pyrinomonadaceae bacterium]
MLELAVDRHQSNKPKQMLSVAIITGIASLLFIALTAGLWLRKNVGNGDLQLIGACARVETPLTPDGTVIVGGELWPAQSTNGAVIPTQSPVRIVGIQDLSLLVEACL